MKNEPPTSNILCEIRLGSDLSASNQRSPANQGQVLELNADETNFREGENHPLVYWIVDGRVA